MISTKGIGAVPGLTDEARALQRRRQRALVDEWGMGEGRQVWEIARGHGLTNEEVVREVAFGLWRAGVVSEPLMKAHGFLKEERVEGQDEAMGGEPSGNQSSYIHKGVEG